MLNKNGLLTVQTIWDPGGTLRARDANIPDATEAPSTSGRLPGDFETLVDTGANINVLARSAAEALGLKIQRCRTWIKMGKGSCRAWGRTIATLTIAGHTFTADFVVLDGLNQRAILGMPTMRAEGAVINCADNCITFAARPLTLHDAKDRHSDARVLHLCDEHGTRESIEDYELFAAYVAAVPEPTAGADQEGSNSRLDSNKGTSTSHPELQSVTDRLCAKYKATVFAPLAGLPPRRGEWDFQIELLDPSLNPIHQKHYKMSAAEKEAVRKELAKLVALGWIDTSSSAWSAPILFARNKKKDGSLRAVYDFRALNARTRANSYPVPRIDDLIDKLAGADLFTLLDLSKAFNQVRVRREDEEKTRDNNI